MTHLLLFLLLYDIFIFACMKQLKFAGNKTLCEHVKTAFFCSRTAPKVMPVVIEEWVKVISAEDYCVICGAQSQMEKLAFSLILRYKVPAILMLATSMPEAWSADIQAALDEGRLLVMTHCDESVHNVTAKSASDRNRLMLEMADNVVVGYCDEDGNIARMLDGYDGVVYLLDDSDCKVAPYVDFYEAHSCTLPDGKKKNTGNMEGCVHAAKGVLSFDFFGEGKERFLKIYQDLAHGGGVTEQSAIRLDVAELADFYAVLPHVYGCLERHGQLDETLVVKSASGDITFGVDYSGDDCTLIVVQTKQIKSEIVRRGAIYVSADSFVSFYDLLKEAFRHFKD